MMLVHPNGLGSQATNADLNISFEPSPDYSGLAKAAAAGDLFAGRVDDAAKLDDMLKEAIESVKSGMGAVLDCKVENGC